jgi:hypothetical protein
MTFLPSYLTRNGILRWQSPTKNLKEIFFRVSFLKRGSLNWDLIFELGKKFALGLHFAKKLPGSSRRPRSLANEGFKRWSHFCPDKSFPQEFNQHKTANYMPWIVFCLVFLIRICQVRINFRFFTTGTNCSSQQSKIIQIVPSIYLVILFFTRHCIIILLIPSIYIVIINFYKTLHNNFTNTFNLQL